jgi:hypothetical protein
MWSLAARTKADDARAVLRNIGTQGLGTTNEKRLRDLLAWLGA